MNTVGKKILVIEDDPDIMFMVQSRLEANGYKVACATSGETGLEMIATEKPDLVILDLILPGINGYEVCTKLKFDFLFTGPVIMLTARIRGLDVQLGYRCGADMYIPKPFYAERLLNEIHRLLDREESEHRALGKN